MCGCEAHVLRTVAFWRQGTVSTLNCSLKHLSAHAYAAGAKSQLSWQTDLWVSTIAVTMLPRRSSPSAGVTMRSTSAWALVHQTKLKSKRILCMDFTVYICLLKVVPKYNASTMPSAPISSCFCNWDLGETLLFREGRTKGHSVFSPPFASTVHAGSVGIRRSGTRLGEDCWGGGWWLQSTVPWHPSAICGICIAFLCWAFIFHQVFDFLDCFHVFIMFSYEVFQPWAPGQESLRNELTGSTQIDMSHKMYKCLRMPVGP